MNDATPAGEAVPALAGEGTTPDGDLRTADGDLPTPGGDAGQTTAEYALVLLGAAAIAGVLVKWATGASGLMKLFGAVLKKLVQAVGG
jgi:hypothetical protein